jgi:tRNA threonylcarbamoyladenosine biosynthesis protein TsaB
LKILALDTSSEHCSAALLLDGDVRQRLELAGQRHSQLLLPMVRSLLDEAGLALGALDGIAAAVGPGSFTGLRIAVSAAQGLAFGADLPVAGVSTLEALAWGLDAQTAVACIDARMGEIYFAACRREHGRLVTSIGPVVAAPAALPDLPPGEVVGGGNAFARYAEGLDARWRGGLTRIDPTAITEARYVAALAAVCHPGGFADSPGSLLPVYVRDKVALRVDER